MSLLQTQLSAFWEKAILKRKAFEENSPENHSEWSKCSSILEKHLSDDQWANKTESLKAIRTLRSRWHDKGEVRALKGRTFIHLLCDAIDVYVLCECVEAIK